MHLIISHLQQRRRGEGKLQREDHVYTRSWQTDTPYTYEEGEGILLRSVHVHVHARRHGGMKHDGSFRKLNSLENQCRKKIIEKKIRAISYCI